MPATAAAEAARLLALGDSLTAGYGLAESESFPARLERTLRTRGFDVRVINAGVSGDTTAGGLARLDWLLAGGSESLPSAAIVSLGANDGLRGIDPAETRANLDAIVGRLRAAGIPVLLAGMRAPPNLGRDYGQAFAAAFAEVRDEHDVLFYPFFLEGVAAVPRLNLEDGIHPNVQGVRVIVEGILPYVETLLGRRD